MIAMNDKKQQQGEACMCEKKKLPWASLSCRRTPPTPRHAWAGPTKKGARGKKIILCPFGATLFYKFFLLFPQIRFPTAHILAAADAAHSFSS